MKVVDLSTKIFMAKRDEIRDTNPPKKLMKWLKSVAKKNGRTVPRQLRILLMTHPLYTNRKTKTNGTDEQK